MSHLLVVRHGQSTWNALGRWQGQADPPLSPLGVEQAELAAKAIDRADLVWSSDLERANHTARILAAPHAVAVTSDARVRERAAGPWTGCTREEIEARDPGFLADGRRPPGYETDDALAARVFSALAEFARALDGGTGLVVSHGGVILTVERAHGIGAATPSDRPSRVTARWAALLALYFIWGSTFIAIAVAVTADPPGPHELRPRRLDGLGRIGEQLASAETAALSDAVRHLHHRFQGMYVIRPSHNPIRPLDLTGAYDDKSDRMHSLEELMERGYEDTYRQFIEPFLGASGDRVAQVARE